MTMQFWYMLPDTLEISPGILFILVSILTLAEVIF